MLRIKHTVSTVTAVVAIAAVAAPAVQANADGPYPRFSPTEHVTRIVDHVPPAAGRGGWLEHTALEVPVGQTTTHATGRVISTSGGIDWTFPVMGAVALVLVMMILGEQVLVRRGRLAS
jgi:hypothetical protein